ncbi:MAG: aldehyde dehydrogenase (NADP(+)) [Mycobacteriaceae bacterium]
MITTTNPATGEHTDTDLRDTSPETVDDLVGRAADAAAALAHLGRDARADLLEAIAASLDSDRATLVATAGQETGLGEKRLDGELSRACFQFRLFAEALREGSYLEAAIDHAGDTPLGPGADLRRMLLPIGPVAVFGSSNFPFAFSVAGGDTASALAAGCPVLIKAHDSHPLTSLRSFDRIAAALSECGAPEASAALVFGQEAAGRLISHPLLRAVSFTGSLTTGKTLLGIINRREQPIPFYGELSSINPLVITPGAASARAKDLAQGLFATVTGSGGQLCTKPGIAFVPAGAGGDQIVSALSALVSEAAGHVMLNERISSSYVDIAARLSSAGATVAARGSRGDGEGFSVPPLLLTTSAADLGPELAEECFGPLVVVARYDDVSEVVTAFDRLPASLTATIHAEPAEVSDQGGTSVVAQLSQAIEAKVGRLVYNGYPTGVRVSWAQHHGGPWPSTNSQHTSVGVTAIRRFLRPFVWQDAPEAVLPSELRDGFDAVPRRIDGVLQLAATSAGRA